MRASPVPEKYGWPTLIKKDGDELFDHYRHTLEALGEEKGLPGLIFNKSQNKFDSAHPLAFGGAAHAQIRSRRISQDPAKLRRLIVDLIDNENWSVMTADLKGDAYEYKDLINRDKASLDIFWLKDESLSESENLPAPEIIAQEQFREIAFDLGGEGASEGEITT